jgi:molybdopterin-containing oxidoreductase family membrane subunit
VDILTFAGTFGLFFTLFLLFLRFLPMVAMAEVKSVMPQSQRAAGDHLAQGDYHGDIPMQHQVSHCRTLLEEGRR